MVCRTPVEGAGSPEEIEKMLTGTMIDDLIGMVSRAEAKAEATTRVREVTAQTQVPSSIYCVYLPNQFEQMRREYASAGAA
jgi:hypothetical protein